MTSRLDVSSVPHIQVPMSLLHWPGLDDGARMLWMLLYEVSITGGQEMFEMSVEQMAHLNETSPVTVRKRRDALAAAGWLDVITLPGIRRKQNLIVKMPAEPVPVPVEQT